MFNTSARLAFWAAVWPMFLLCCLVHQQAEARGHRLLGTTANKGSGTFGALSNLKTDGANNKGAATTEVPTTLCVAYCNGTNLTLNYNATFNQYEDNTGEVNLYFVSWETPAFWVLRRNYEYFYVYQSTSPDPTGTYDYDPGGYNYPCTGSVTVTAGATTYEVTGGGAYCGSGSGVAIGLRGSQIGITYQLQLDGANNGDPVSGTGNVLSFGNKTATGTYTVVATVTAGGCTAEMSGSATVTAGTPPTAYEVTGGGPYCTLTEPGALIGMANSQTDVAYQLRQNGADIDIPITGYDGAAFDFYYYPAGTYTVIATNLITGCTAEMSNSVEVSESNYCVNDFYLENETQCLGGQNTTCISDDVWTADIVVSFGAIPPTGELIISSNKLVNGSISIPVGQLSGTSHTIVGAEFLADGLGLFQIESGFSINGTLVYRSNHYGKRSCSNPAIFGQSVVVSGMSGSCGLYGNGTYSVHDFVNGTLEFKYLGSGGPSLIRWTGTEWEIFHNFFARLAYAPGTPDQLPCSGWVAVVPISGCGDAPTLTVDCDVPLILSSCDITQIDIANAGNCNGKGTTATTDDTFTADVTVNFAYAPTGGTLTLKRNGATIASTNDASLDCSTSWTFTGVEMAADGASIVLTAEFSTSCAFTSTSLGTAPTACSCVPTTAFTTCPMAQSVHVATGSCANTVTYSAVANGTPAPTYTYVFSGATTTSGAQSGTGSGSDFNKGQTTVTLTATNACGSATCSFVVTVTDNIPPSIACPSPVSLPTAPSQCGANASWTAPIGTDNCPNVNTSSSHTPGSFFAKGQTTVTYTATDGAGLSSACSFTVTVGDSQAPTLACPASTTHPNTSGQCGAVVTYAPTVTENCPGTTVTLQSGLASGATFPIGTTTITLLATDGAALTNTCSFTITVQDTEKPVITCPNSITRNTDAGQCSAVVTYTNPTYTDNCPAGGNTGLDHLEGGLSGAVFPKGSTIVKWMATDAANLTATCTFTITVTDGQAPSITCPANQSVNTDLGVCAANVSYPTPAASDNCTLPTGQPTWVSGGNAPTASGNSQTATFSKGITTVQWKVTDGAGLTRTCTFRVVVNDREKPTLTCPSNIQVNATVGACSAIVTYTAPSFTDNCAPTSGTAVRTSGLPSGSSFPAGTAAVVFRATDAAGTTNTCSMQVTVVDNEAPVVTCPASTTVTGSGIPCAAQVFYGSVTASDNCSGTLTPFLDSGLGNGSLFPSGVTTNTFRAVASNGQTGECSFSVTVNCPSAKPGSTNEKAKNQTPATLFLYPNPATEAVWANFGAISTTGGLLTVFDALGRTVWQRQLAEGQSQTAIEDLQGWPSGVYRVVLKTNQQSATKQLVVE